MKKHSFYLLFLLLFAISSVKAQKELTLKECQDLLQKNNLSLLAGQYDVSISEANVIQAKVWEQPYFSGEFNAIKPNEHTFFNVGAKGEKAFEIQQLIYLGGKKRNEVNFAKSNLELAKNQFEQLLRNLDFQLKVNFYQLYFNRQKYKSLSSQVGNLDTLIVAYKKQADKGNIPLKDVVRLQSLSINFKGQLLDLQKEFLDTQQTIKLLTGTNQDVLPKIPETELQVNLNKELNKTIADLEKKVLYQNLEVKYQQKVSESQELYLKWQKSLATPDLTMGSSYDQRGGAFDNQVNLTFGIPLPVWNKNKGNIKIAKYSIEQSKINKQQKENELINWINNAYQTYLYQKKQYNQSASESQNFSIVYSGVLKNFQRTNISLIEFTDFMESYNQTFQFLSDIKMDLLITEEKINYLTNETIF